MVPLPLFWDNSVIICHVLDGFMVSLHSHSQLESGKNTSKLTNLRRISGELPTDHLNVLCIANFAKPTAPFIPNRYSKWPITQVVTPGNQGPSIISHKLS